MMMMRFSVDARIARRNRMQVVSIAFSLPVAKHRDVRHATCSLQTRASIIHASSAYVVYGWSEFVQNNRSLDTLACKCSDERVFVHCLRRKKIFPLSIVLRHLLKMPRSCGTTTREEYRAVDNCCAAARCCGRRLAVLTACLIVVLIAWTLLLSNADPPVSS